LATVGDQKGGGKRAATKKRKIVIPITFCWPLSRKKGTMRIRWMGTAMSTANFNSIWSSDVLWVAAYSVLLTVFVLAWAYIPA
jgi:hypothetical protein